MRIEDYGFIGDTQAGALVGNNGSIDWLCLPRFDGDACFASLLGGPDHGRWQISPTGGAKKATRRYVGNSLILETTFETDDGLTGDADLRVVVPPHDVTIVRTPTSMAPCASAAWRRTAGHSGTRQADRRRRYAARPETESGGSGDCRKQG